VVYSRFLLQRKFNMADPIHLALIDDDAAVRDSLQLYLTRQASGCLLSGAEEFLKAANAASRSIAS